MLVLLVKEHRVEVLGKGREFAGGLCLPWEVQQNTPTSAARKVGPCPAGRVTSAHQMRVSLFLQHRNHEVPMKLFYNRLKEEEQYDLRIECGSLPRTLCSPDVFMGFKRLQSHSGPQPHLLVQCDHQIQPLLL